jgi:hypothetical protein
MELTTVNEIELEVDMNHYCIEVTVNIEYEVIDCDCSSYAGEQEVTESWIERDLFDHEILKYTRYFDVPDEIKIFIPQDEKEYIGKDGLYDSELKAIQAAVIDYLDCL